MQAVVAAGGYGTRLYPLTASKPKHVLPILDETVIGRLVSSLARHGVREVIVTLSYHPEEVILALSGIRRPTVLFSFEAEPRGTAGGVREILDVLEDRFLFLNGDVYHNLDLGRLMEFHERSGALATIALKETERPWEYGIVKLSEDGRITAFQEKPRRGEEFSNLINAGIYVLEREVIERFVNPGVFTDFSKHVFPRVLKTGRLYGLLLEGDWIDVGRPGDLLMANFMEMRRRGLTSFVASGARTEGDIQGSIVLEGAVVEEEARVHESLIMPRAVVERGALVRRSILGEGSRVAPGSTVVDSVLGDGSFFEGMGESLRIM